jgi:hypothetical protein
MPFQKGNPGRPRGSKDKRHVYRDLASKACARLGVDPFAVAALICKGELPCTACRGEGKTRFQPARGQMRLSVRTCESCYGSGKEKITPQVRMAAAKELMEYQAPKLRALQGSDDPDAPPIRAAVRLTIVNTQSSAGNTDTEKGGR